MSKADRNKHMIDVRNQWLLTKDGQITIKTGDVNHAYAEGYLAGRKSNTNNSYTTTSEIIKSCRREQVMTILSATPAEKKESHDWGAKDIHDHFGLSLDEIAHAFDSTRDCINKRLHVRKWGLEKAIITKKRPHIRRQLIEEKND